ncbi:50S ribosomal protein L21 [Candidatus Peregrinibacteria bacterium]|nr:50S ribosomal protein L21 [Candidatus Peregrinibacteria bacterium]
MFAIVDIAGFQERVEVGAKLAVPTLGMNEGGSLTFDKVFLVSNGDALTVGTPYVKGASVEVKVLGHGRGDKIRVYKMRRRKRYRRTHGHKQGFTEVEVLKIKAS